MSPPKTPQKTTSCGGTQTSPPRSNQLTKVDQGTQGQLECNQHEEDNTSQPKDNGKGSKGKKGKKNQPGPASPHPGTSAGISNNTAAGASTGGNTVPRADFTFRNLGTGRPSIQYTACGE